MYKHMYKDQTFVVYRDPALEAAARDAIRLDEPRALLDRFITLVRESGTADERTAADLIVGRLQALGIPVTVHEPELYISNPVRAELTLNGAAGTRVVRTDQPHGAIATYLCEARSDDGFVACGVIPEPKAGEEFPVARVLEPLR